MAREGIEIDIYMWMGMELKMGKLWEWKYVIRMGVWIAFLLTPTSEMQSIAKQVSTVRMAETVSPATIIMAGTGLTWPAADCWASQDSVQQARTDE